MTGRVGQVVTFYSYEGGVGRTFLVANVAATLARWGNRVVCVDWDLEEARLNEYFAPYVRESEPGLLELTETLRAGGHARWADHLTRVDLPGPGRIDLISAGHGAGYQERVRSLDWNTLYDEHHFGIYLEVLRRELKREYDFILMDSRTGLTDVGAICAVQLPDLLIAVVGPNEHSVDGTIQVASRIPPARDRLAFDRLALPVVPVISTFDRIGEPGPDDQQMAWVRERLAPLCRPWLPVVNGPAEMLSRTTLPRISARNLAALDTRSTSPESLTWTIDNLSALLVNGLDAVRGLLTDRDSFVRRARTQTAARAVSYDLYLSAPPDRRRQVNDLHNVLVDDDLQVFTSDQLDGEPILDRVQVAVRASSHLVLLVDERLAPLQQFELESFLTDSVQRSSDSQVVVVRMRGGSTVHHGLSLFPTLEWSTVWSTAAEVELILRLRWRSDIGYWTTRLGQREQAFSSFAPVVVATRRCLTRAYLEAGNPAGAVAVADKMFDVLTDVHPPNSEHALRAQTFLARAYHAAGKAAEAAEQYQLALDGQIRVLGAEAQDTLRTRYGLGVVYGTAGRVRESLDQLEQALAAQERTLGQDNPDSLCTSAAVARVLLRHGRVAEAISRYRHTLEAMRRVLGPRHPYTLQTTARLARAYRLDNRLPHAIELFEETAKAQARTLGDDHQETLGTRARLASAYQAVGRLAEAAELFKHAFDGQRRTLTAHHPDTLRTQVSLADVWVAAGRVDEAIDLYRLALIGQRRILGDGHPVTLETELSLAKAYAQSDRTADDSDLERITLEHVERYLYDTLRTALTHQDLAQAARIYHQLGAVEAQRERNEEVVKNYGLALQIEKELGNWRAAAATRYQLGLIEQQRGRLDAAVVHFKHVIEEALAGDDQPTAIAACHRLGEVAYRGSRPKDALPHFREALTFAIDDDSRAKALYQLGSVALDLRHLEEAELAFRQALAVESDAEVRTSIYLHLGELAEDTGRLEEARNHYEQALESAATSDQDATVSEASFKLGSLSRLMGDS